MTYFIENKNLKRFACLNNKKLNLTNEEVINFIFSKKDIIEDGWKKNHILIVTKK